MLVTYPRCAGSTVIYSVLTCLVCGVADETSGLCIVYGVTFTSQHNMKVHCVESERHTPVIPALGQLTQGYKY